jgi:hypothetical protein
MDRPNDSGKNRTQLANLRVLAATPPKTKSGQVVWAWAEIQASLNSGRSLKEIWEALRLDGIVMSYDQFRVYVSRTRKRFARREEMAPASSKALQELEAPPAASTPARDPLANIRRESERKRASGFNYDPVPNTAATGAEPLGSPRETAAPDELKAGGKRDPWANVRRSEAKRPGFHYRPFEPGDEKDLI